MSTPVHPGLLRSSGPTRWIAEPRRVGGGEPVGSGTIAGMADVLTEAPDAPSAPAPRRRGWGWVWPPVAAVGAGLAMLLAFPPIGLWPFAFVGVALLAVATHRRGFWVGTLLGLLAGLALLIPLLSWAGGFVGPVWLILPF